MGSKFIFSDRVWVNPFLSSINMVMRLICNIPFLLILHFQKALLINSLNFFEEFTYKINNNNKCKTKNFETSQWPWFSYHGSI